MSNKKKELKNAYKQTHTQMGIFQIRNLVNEKVLVGSSLNLPGALNLNKFQLVMGNHQNRLLQAEWQEFGAERFVFEILDELSATEGAEQDYKADLAFLEEFWLDKLRPYDERGYNEKKIDREERLRRIAEKRLSKP